MHVCSPVSPASWDFRQTINQAGAVPPTEIIRPLHFLHECGPQAARNNSNGRYFSRTLSFGTLESILRRKFTSSLYHTRGVRGLNFMYTHPKNSWHKARDYLALRPLISLSFSLDLNSSSKLTAHWPVRPVLNILSAFDRQICRASEVKDVLDRPQQFLLTRTFEVVTSTPFLLLPRHYLHNHCHQLIYLQSNKQPENSASGRTCSRLCTYSPTVEVSNSTNPLPDST